MVKGGVYFLISLLNQNKMTERGRYYKIEKRKWNEREKYRKRESKRERGREGEREVEK